MVARPPAAAGAVGVVLAGGASRRLGEDKALLAAGGESLAARAVRKLRERYDEVTVADGGRGLVPGVPSLPDGPGRGPMAGLLGAAAAYPERALMVLACDLPEVPEVLLTALVIASGGEADWVVPRWGGRLEPLCAIYQPAALAALTRRAAAGRFALHELADEPGLRIAYLDDEDIAGFGDPARIFLNLNTPDDVARWRRWT
ncbi:MAG TPA: molybdenum cofactor guanylyltransferase [Thermoanaerobaculia bacterium]|nr:molybdenum cofactor guanylyltransferase [Thermoanaerobaculia bacterium]